MDERDIERSAQIMADQLEYRIACRVQYLGESARQCRDCGDEIPEGRRQALPGIQTCVDCAALAGK